MRDLNKESVRILFLGTGWESVATLKALFEDKRFSIVGVITTPDKPVGRKQILTPSDVKKYAIENSIPVYHTEKKKERYLEALDIFKPELVVCKAFGEIVPKEFLEYPRYRCINVHFSILPKYRGAVPIQKAILDGEKKTGISIMLMSEGLDEGDILSIYEEEILKDDTNVSLRERLVRKSAQILGDILERWVNGEITPVKQDNNLATYCWQRDISKERAEINWKLQDAEYVDRMIRAFVPWPVAWTVLPEGVNKNISKKIMKIFKAELIQKDINKESGLLFSENGMVYFATRDSSKLIHIIDFQIEGKNRTNEKEFLNGIGREFMQS